MDSHNPIPTSEVGSPQPQVNPDDRLCALLEMQHRNLIEVLSAVKNAQAAPSASNSVTFPKFNPDSAGSSASTWCSTVDLILGENPLDGSALLIALTKYLEGGASNWLSQICFAGMTWIQFKEMFLQQFEGNETPAATVFNVLNSRPNDGECLALYGSRLVTTLMAKWKTMTPEEIAVSVALSHSATIDARLQRTLFTTTIKTRNELQNELRAFSFAKRKEHSDPENFVSKKVRLQTPVKCHFCGKMGHKIADCRSRKNNMKPQGPSSSSARSSESKAGPITCYRCGNEGHIASACPKRQPMGSQSKTDEKRVNLCHVAEPIGTLISSGESYLFCFDSEAECSLVRESVSMKLSGTRVNNIVTLKGIGNNTVTSTL
ncbi:uncharacterized protein LOC115065757 [Bactrocera dorsalis]|uniref:Uncharacterized protein LOC115065757 n=1 Tax=Bactrocera dorsalis TaxID=27457 RepID=A0A8N4KYA2_BACDO|nr:uncharacterized protein LOC115065757 [Bactrocera dorsalis]